MFTNVNGTLYFVATDGTNGRELWKSDGTSSGTLMVKDIISGSGSSSPTTLTNVNGTLYFAANDGTNGKELWKSDGTSSGTVMVKDIASGSGSSSPTTLTNVNGTLYFAATDGTNGIELWKSDGTSSGTVTVKDIASGSGSSSPTTLTNVNGTLYFAATNGTSGIELWKSDGTSTGTVMVKDIKSGSSGSIPAALTDVNGTLYFTADNGTTSIELWKSDGTSSGTVMVKDISTTSASNVSNLTNVSGMLYFSASNSTNGIELWTSDGTSSGTVMVKDIVSGSGTSSPTKLTNVNGTLFLSATDGTNGKELWKSDGTSSGTVMVKDIASGSASSSPAALTNVNGTLYFAATDGTNGSTLWKSNGTSSGTVMLKDVNAGTSASDPFQFTESNGDLYFVPSDSRLWKSNGTIAGTISVSNPLFAIDNVIDLDGTVFFTRNGELWKSDGTLSGTALVKQIYDGSHGSIWPHDFINVSDTLYFTATNGSDGNELWKSDGTSSGTVMVKDIRVGSTGSIQISYYANVNGTLYFVADNGTNGVELWKSDGTSSGTVMVKDIATGSGSSSPTTLTNVNGTLYFAATDGTNGRELWKSDGTSSGTVMVKDINSGSGSSSSATLINVNGTLYFTATDGTNGIELWKSDGTSSGTVMVKDINSGSGTSSSANFIAVGNILYFTATNGTNGEELWKSDGTSSGTVMVKDINPGAGSSRPANSSLLNFSGMLYFVATDGNSGEELWRSDGTSSGTIIVKDIWGGPTYSSPYQLTAANGTLYFRATDPFAAVELFQLAPPTAVPGSYTVSEGSVISLSAEASTDPDSSEILSFAWDLDDDGIFGETGGAATRGNETGATPTFSAAGLGGPDTFPIALRVTNSVGLSDTDTINVTITNVAPAIDVIHDETAYQSVELEWSGSFVDPGLGETYTVSIDWGDATSPDSITPTGTGTTRSLAALHTYATPGTYSAVLTVTDSDGAYDTETFEVTTYGPPSVPTSFLGAATSATEILIGWAEVEHATTYDIQRSDNGTDWDDLETIAASEHSYEDGGLNEATQYWYRVRAVNPAGASAYTNAAAPITWPATPTRPSGLVATPSTTSVSLAWDESTDDVEVDTYIVYRDGVEIDQTSDLEFVDDEVDAATHYFYSIAARNTFGNDSPASEAVGVTTLGVDTTAPSIPTSLTNAGITARSIALTWTASTDNLLLQGYEIYDSAVLIGSSATNSFVHSQVTPGSSHTYTVRAVDAAGNFSSASSSYSVSASADSTAPATPTNVAASAITSETVTLTWSFTFLGGKDVHFAVKRDGNVIGTTTRTWYQDGSLDPLTTYAYSIVAVDDVANASTATTPINVVTSDPDETAPADPTSLTVLNVSATSVLLSWSPAVDPEGGTVDYVVFRDEVIVGTTAATVFFEEGLSASTSYDYAIVARDSEGNLSDSATGEAVTASAAASDTTAPSVPDDLELTYDYTFPLTWSPSTDNSFLAGYEILRNDEVIAITTEPLWSDETGSPETTYEYTVRAFDLAGNRSSSSAPITYTSPADVQAPIAGPTFVVADVDSETVTLHWDPAYDNLGVDRYEIMRRLRNADAEYDYQYDTFTVSASATEYIDEVTIDVSAGDEVEYDLFVYDAADNWDRYDTADILNTYDQWSFMADGGQYITEPFKQYFKDELLPKLREYATVFSVDPPDALGWFDWNNRYLGHDDISLYPIRQTTDVYVTDANSNDEYDTGEWIWTGGYPGLFNPTYSSTAVGGSDPLVGATGSLEVDMAYIDVNNNEIRDDGEELTRNVDRIAGSVGHFAYVDVDRNRSWSPGEEAIWIDTNDDLIYQTSEQVLMEGSASLVGGEQGNNDRLYYYDANDNGVWNTDELLIWQDYLPGWANRVDWDSNFNDDVAGWFDALDDMIDVAFNVGGTTDINAVGDFFADHLGTINGIGTLSTSETSSHLIGSGTALSSQISFGSAYIQIDGEWYRDVYEIPNGDEELELDDYPEEAENEPFIISGWKAIPEQAATADLPEMHEIRGSTTKGDPLFPSHFEQIGTVISGLADLDRWYSESESDALIAVAMRTINAYADMINLDDPGFMTKIMGGSADPGAPRDESLLGDIAGRINSMADFLSPTNPDLPFSRLSTLDPPSPSAMQGYLDTLYSIHPWDVTYEHQSQAQPLSGPDVPELPDADFTYGTRNDYYNIVSDTDVDGIVQVAHNLDGFGNATGLIDFDIERPDAQVFIPLSLDTTGLLPIHGYLSQGGFSSNVADQPLLQDFMAPGSELRWDYADLAPQHYILPLAYSLGTTAHAQIAISDGINHVKRAVVRRPQGNEVIFDFAWNPNTLAFDPVGTPLTRNGRADDKRLYTLRDLTPTDNYDDDFEMYFASGISLNYSGKLQSLRSADGRETNYNQVFADHEIPGYPISKSTFPFDVQLEWNGAEFGVGHLGAVKYTTRGSDGDPEVLETVLEYDPLPTPHSAIVGLAKARLHDGAPDEPIPQFSQRISPDGTTIESFGSTLERDEPEAGVVLFTQSLNGIAGVNTTRYTLEDSLLVQEVEQTVAGATGSATTRYLHNEGTGRYAQNGSPQWGKVSQIVYPDQTTESFEYDLPTGWVTSTTRSVGTGNDVRTELFAYDNAVSGGVSANTYSLVERPRESIVSIDGKAVEHTLIRYSPSMWNDGYFEDDPSYGSTGYEVRAADPGDDDPTWEGSSFQLAQSLEASPYDPFLIVSKWRTPTGGGKTELDIHEDGTAGRISYAYGPLGALLSTTEDVVSVLGNVLESSTTDPRSGIELAASEATEDAFGRVTQIQSLGGLVQKYEDYGWFGPRKITDPFGVESDLVYDEQGRVRQQTKLGVVTKLNYDGAGHAIRTTTKGDTGPTLVTTAGYDALGRVKFDSDVEGRYTSYGYGDTEGGTTATTTFNDGTTIVDVHAADGSLVSSAGTATYPQAFSSGVDAEYHPTLKTGDVGFVEGDPIANAATGGFWTKASENDGQTWVQTFYDPQGRPYRVERSGASNPEIVEYDERGRQVRQIAVDGTTTLSEYDIVTGDVSAVITDMDRDGTYSPGDRKSRFSRIFAEGTFIDGGTTDVMKTTTTTLGATPSVVVRETSVDGLHAKQTVNGLTSESATILGSPGSWTVRSRNPDGTYSEGSYADGLLDSSTFNGVDDSVVTEQTFGYDSLNRNNTITDGLERTTTFTFFNDGQVKSIERPDGRIESVQGRDPKTGRATVAKRADAGIVRSEVNEKGQVKNQSGAGVYSVGYTFDEVTGAFSGLTTHQTGAGGAASTTVEHSDTTGQVESKSIAGTTVLDPHYTGQIKVDTITLPGVTGTVGYNAAGESTSRGLLNTASAQSLNFTTQLDTAGLQRIVTESVDGKTTARAVGYNAQRQLQFETSPIVSGVRTEYEYYATDDASADASPGALKFMRLKRGSTTLTEYEYKYDEVTKRLKSISDGTHTFTYGYKADTNLIESLTGGGVEVTYDYDTLTDRLSSISTSDGTDTVYQAAYEYYDNDQRSTATITGTSATAIVYDYDYDALDQLASASGSLGGTPVIDRQFTYAFDGIGNRTGAGSYNLANQVSGPHYDNRGNLHEDASFIYDYDALDRLIAAEAKDHSVRVEMGYDGEGRRTTKRTYSWNGTTSAWDLSQTIKFVYDGWNLIAEFDGSDVQLRSYAWGIDLGGGIGGLLSITDYTGVTPETYVPFYDGSGNIAGLIDTSDSSVAASYEYDPFGNLMDSSGPAAVLNPFRFSTKYFDTETELYYYGYRYYSPDKGRWITRDPSGESGGVNLYSFVSNDPINRIDKLGLADVTVVSNGAMKLLTEIHREIDASNLSSNRKDFYNGAIYGIESQWDNNRSDHAQAVAWNGDGQVQALQLIVAEFNKESVTGGYIYPGDIDASKLTEIRLDPNISEYRRGLDRLIAYGVMAFVEQAMIECGMTAVSEIVEGVAWAIKVRRGANAVRAVASADPAVVEALTSMSEGSIIRESQASIVADSNMFMDRAVAAKHMDVRAILDEVIVHPDVQMLVPDMVRAEVNPSPSQLSRLLSSAPRTEIAATDVSEILAQYPGILSSKFGIEDLQLLETARINGFPVVTSNSAMVNQVASNAARKALYGDIDILVPGLDFSTATELVDLVRSFTGM